MDTLAHLYHSHSISIPLILAGAISLAIGNRLLMDGRAEEDMAGIFDGACWMLGGCGLLLAVGTVNFFL